MSLPSVALTGRRASGKSTIAALLTRHYGYTRHSWADPVKALVHSAYGPLEESSRVAVRRDGDLRAVSGLWLYQRVGTEALREQVDEDFWVHAGLRRIAEQVNEPHCGAWPRRWVNADTRFANEVAALRNLGWLIVRLDCADTVRLARLEARGDPDLSLDDTSEQLDGIEPDLALDTSAVSPYDTLRELVAALEASSTLRQPEAKGRRR
jgi:dephospho-CoA kinase